jgi:hypothetical protein
MREMDSAGAIIFVEVIGSRGIGGGARVNLINSTSAPRPDWELPEKAWPIALGRSVYFLFPSLLRASIGTPPYNLFFILCRWADYRRLCIVVGL